MSKTIIRVHRFLFFAICIGLILLVLHLHVQRVIFQEEIKPNTSAVIDYIKRITKISDIRYISLLRNAVNTYNLSKELDTEKLKLLGPGFPCLIPPYLRIRYEKEKWNGFSLPILTSTTRGRFGNIMGEYASLLALGRLYNVTVFLHPKMKNNLISVFPYLSMKELPENKIAEWVSVANVPPSLVNFSPLEVAAAGLFGPKFFSIAAYPFEIKLFNIIRNEILKEFIFAEKYAKEANEFLLSVKNEMKMRSPSSTNFTFINFHIRRKDYLGHITLFKGDLPGENYYQKALNYYRTKYPSSIFVASSDDRNYLIENMKNESDIFIVPDVDGATAMAILSACNHSIITVGSYGFWSGYLTGGEVVFSDCKCKLPYPFSKENYEEAKLTFFHNL